MRAVDYNRRKNERKAAMSMALLPMTTARLKVVRTTEFGAFLDAGTGRSEDDILLHKNQQTARVRVGDEIEVLLYLDPKKKMAASMRLPSIVEGGVARARVMSVTRDGAFVDLGAERGIFLPFAEMIGRPMVGETVRVKLYRDKSGRLAASMKGASSTKLRAEDKADQLDRDGERLLKYMRRSDGFINENMTPRAVQENFRMSKAAFKRALGHLYKKRMIERLGDGFKLAPEDRGDA